VRQPYEFASKTQDDNSELISILTKILEKPNNEDTRRTFKSAIYEDLVSGDCGCFEVATTGNPYRPLFLFPVDGFSVEFVLDHKTFKYAQRVTDSMTSVPIDYQYFTDSELVYLKKQVFTNNPFGLSPIESAFEYIKALTQTFHYSADIASNALPKYMANIKGLQGEQLNAYRSYFVSECMGTPNLPLVSAEDIESAQISPISEEATFKAYMEFVIGIIAICFGIPPEKLSIAKSNDRSTIEEINSNLLQDCILYRLKNYK
jgi:phage portal protein BeeE